MGVYVPSVLTILGLVMYLRLGWALGNLGLPLMIFIVVISSMITFITGMSASAIATNMRIGVGGEYYIIAHSLGLELGGAIGMPLYLCRTLSITFYSFGLAESFAVLWPQSMGVIPPHMIQFIAVVIIVIITVLSGKSASLALRLQIPIMIAVGLSIIALVIGAFSTGLRSPEMTTTYRSAPEGFWYVFAVFFPAVTGFTAGIGMSGDLKDSSRSIPRGTILAVLTGVVVYISIPIVFSVTNSVGFEMLSERGIDSWTQTALLGPVLVFAGMWGAILSSAFGSVLAGPRVLQALSEDGLAPKFLSRLSKSGQPTIATWVTGALAIIAVSLGDLNAVAQFVTILFLTLYVIINLSAAMEKMVGDPSYRPTINVPWHISMIGAMGALFVMFLLNPVACVVAMAVELGIYLVLRNRALRKRWGDVRAGMWMSLARFSLVRLKKHKIEPRNWRPHIIVFTDSISTELDLVYLAACFNQNRGIITACQVIEGMLSRDKIEIGQIKASMDRVLDDNNIIAFSEVNVAPDFITGVINIAQANGVGTMGANTVMFGWPKRTEKLVSQLKIMRTISNIEICTIIARLAPLKGRNYKGRIDLWWGGLENNGDLMFLLAHLLKMNPRWEKARIVVRSIVNDDRERIAIENNLRELIQSVRIKAESEVVVRKDGMSLHEVIVSNSKDADLVLFGLMIPERGQEYKYAERMMELSEGLNSVVYIRNASRFSGKLL